MIGEIIALFVIVLLSWVILDVTKDQDSFLHGQAGVGIWALLGLVYASIKLTCIFILWSFPVVKNAIYQWNQLSGR